MKDTSFLTLLASYWWVLMLVLALVLYKFILKIFGVIIIPENKIGLVTKKFVLLGENKNLPSGRIIATNGEAGMQAQTLPPGIHYWKWFWQYNIDKQDFIIIEAGKIGLIMAKDGHQIPVGQILGNKVECDNFQDAEAFLNSGGMKGRQSAIITAGSYRINPYLFEVSSTPITEIGDGKVGVVTTFDGEPLVTGDIAGKSVEGHSNFQDPDGFLKNKGNRGLQPQVILAGAYNINPWFAEVEEVDMTEIPIGSVGVIISYVGDEGVDSTGPEFKHGNIVGPNQKGVRKDFLNPGKHPMNTFTMKVEVVPTTNLVLNWAAARTESHNLDANLSTITVRSKDGFTFNLDVSQIIHIPAVEAAKVIARFGSLKNLVSQVLEPTIGNYFRNSAQSSDVIDFLTNRKERQDEAKLRIQDVLGTYNVNAVDTLIGDIHPPEELMKTLTERKIATEMTTTYRIQMEAQKTREELNKQQAIAEMQPKMVEANQNVEIAEKHANAKVKEAQGNADSVKLNAAAEAERIKLTGDAEAGKIKAIGKAQAEAYKEQVSAMGEDNFTNYKIMEAVGQNGIEIMPKVLIMGSEGGSGGPISALLGFKVLESLGDLKHDKKNEPEKDEHSKVSDSEKVVSAKTPELEKDKDKK